MNQGAYWDYGNSGVELESGLRQVLLVSAPLKFWPFYGAGSRDLNRNPESGRYQ